MSIAEGDIVRPSQCDSRNELLGMIERMGKREARVAFRRLPWTDPEATIPEMLSYPLEMLEKCRDPWSDWANQRWSSVADVMLRVRGVQLWLANNQGQLGNALTDLLPHQLCLVHEVIERKRRRLLIAEEVGMGKTIETGMIIHALMQRRELARCLIVCPAGQISQWQDELERKLKLSFDIYRRDIDGKRAFTYPYVIASIDTIKMDFESKKLQGKSHRQILLEAPDWDLVVFDEAHRLSARLYGSKTDKTQNYQLAEELSKRTRDFLMLTGTPHDGNDSKFHNLMKALEPEVCFSRKSEGVYFGDLILKNRKSEARDANGELLFKNVKVERVTMPALSTGEAQFHSQLTHYLKIGYGVAEQDPQNPRNRALGFVMVTFQKLASSSAAAVRAALTKRHASLTNAAYLAKEIDTEDDRYLGESEEAKANLRSASELRESFVDDEIQMLGDLLAQSIPEEAKWIELMTLIRSGNKVDNRQKYLIFTEYRGTLAFLEHSLTAEFGKSSVVTIKGGMQVDERMNAMQTFRNDPECQFLISTEAGGEGINLQFCNIVINYDQPWNPFRVAQRIGRVNRIGQRRDMRVINLRLRNELDDRLNSSHEARVDSAVARLSEVTGLVAVDIRDQLLGYAQDFINYDKIFRSCLTESNSVQSSDEEIAEGIRKAEEAYKTAYDTIFREAISPFNPDRFREIIGCGLGLEDFKVWLDLWLKQCGRRMMHRKPEDVYEFIVPDHLKNELPISERTVRGTFDRNKAINDPSCQLLAFGHPIIDMIARDALASDHGLFICQASANERLQKNSILACAVVEENNASGSCSHRLVCIRSTSGGSWEPCAVDVFASLESAPKELLTSSSDHLYQIRDSLRKYLDQDFDDSEFLYDRTHLVCLTFIV